MTQDSVQNLKALVSDPRRQHGTLIRAQTERAIRRFFDQRAYLETRTPLLVPSPGMEPHIRPLAVHRHVDQAERVAFLPTSPEFAMKRLLAGGLEKIYQICPAFRDEPRSPEHLVEFTMLEFYLANATYEDLMRETESLMRFLAVEITGKEKIEFKNQTVSFETPFPRYRVRDLFREYASIDLHECSSFDALARECKKLKLDTQSSQTWDDLYFLIWLNQIETKLPTDRAFFVIDYPASQAALSVKTQEKDGFAYAKRFEVYAGALELGNAFEELVDPVEQRARFVADMNLRERTYGAFFPKSPIDEGFIRALEEGMPASAGIAMGVDRLIMLLANEADIQFTHWLPRLSDNA